MGYDRRMSNECLEVLLVCLEWYVLFRGGVWEAGIIGSK
jgi:hypothetical protein